jgi:hypothetical protein
MFFIIELYILENPYKPHDKKVCGRLFAEHLIPKSWAVRTASTLLGRLSTRCWNIAAGTCFHSAVNISEVEHWCRTIRPGSQSAFQFIPKVFDRVEVRALCMSVLPHRSRENIYVWTSLCTWGNCHDETGKGLSPNCCHKVGSAESSRISWYAVALRFPFTGTKGPKPWKTALDHYSFSTKLYSWYYALGKVVFSWVMNHILWSDESHSLEWWITRFHCSGV